MVPLTSLRFGLVFRSWILRPPLARNALVLGFALGSVGSARAELRFPQLSSLARESPREVTPGARVTYRLSVQPGTVPIRSIALAFSALNNDDVRVVRTEGPAFDSVAATLDATWLNGGYQLDTVTVTDAWLRTVSYRANGSVVAATRSDAQTPFYTGSLRHGFDLPALGLVISGGGARPAFTSIDTITTLTPGPLTPGQTARFRYSGTRGTVGLTGLQLSFRNLSTNALLAVSAATSEPNGELSLPIVPEMGNGRYSLNLVSLTDTAGRTIAFSSPFSGSVSSGGMVFSVNLLSPFNGQNDVTIAGARLTAPLPQLATWSRDGNGELSVGDTLRFNFTTTGPFPVVRVLVQLAGPFGSLQEYTSTEPNGSLVLPITADWITGTYRVSTIVLTDGAGSRFSYSPGGGATVPPSGPVPAPAEMFRATIRGQAVAPYFVNQPAAETRGPLNASVTLQASAVGASGRATYAWFRGQPGDTSTPITEGLSLNGAALSVRVTGPATYWVQASSDGQTVASTAALVDGVALPQIDEQPRDQILHVGDTAVFSVTALPGSPLTYRWQTGRFRAGVVYDQPTLQFKVEGAADAGPVYCEVTNAAGTTRTVVALLTVLAAETGLRFTAEPADRTVAAGASVALVAQFTGNPPLTARWQKNGVDLSLGEMGLSMLTPIHSNRLGETSTLTLSPANLSHAGVYRLVVTNGFEIAYSRPIRVTIDDAPVIVTPPTAATSAILGSSFRLSVAATGRPPLIYQWRHNGVPIPGANGNEFSRFSITAAAAGTYDVMVANAVAAVTSAGAEVTVRPPPILPGIQNGPTDRTVQAGETVTFTVEPTGDNTRCVWYKETRALQDGPNRTFTLVKVGASDAGRYRILVGSPTGTSIGRDFTLTVLPAQDRPVIVRPPVGSVIRRGETALLNVGVDGLPPFRLQWRFNGVPIARDTGPYGFDETTLFVPNFDSSRLGSYDVVVTNAHGTVTSPPAMLALPPPSDAGRIMNLSVRASAGGAHGPLIVGFVIGGGLSEDAPVLIRAAGRALEAFGVADTLANPVATLYAGPLPRFANDDWAGFRPVATAAARVGAFPFPTAGSRDAAFAPALPSGSYTVHVTSADATAGTALAEIYDATPAAEITLQRPRLLNLSVQTVVTAGQPGIVGFTLGGAQPRQILVRAAGPSLAAFGVAGTAGNPRLTLFSGASAKAENDDWAGAVGLAETFGRVGAFNFIRPDSKDAALVATLPPGSYTAQVSEESAPGGLVLVEVYEVP